MCSEKIDTYYPKEIICRYFGCIFYRLICLEDSEVYSYESQNLLRV